GKTCPTRRPVLHFNKGGMRLGDARNDGKTETSAAGAPTVPAPEAPEDEFALIVLDAGTLIQHADDAVLLDHDLDGRLWRRMVEPVLDQVANCARDHFRIAVDPYRLFGATERDALALRECQWRREFRELRAYRPQVRLFRGVDREALQLRDVEQLTHDPRHAVDVLVQRLSSVAVHESVDARAQDRQRGAQLMGGIAGKFPLHLKSGGEAIECLIDRLDEGEDLARNILRREPHLRSF